VHWLGRHHPGFRGPSVCPSRRSAPQMGGGILCLAEIHQGLHYIEVWATAERGATISFKHVSTGSWTRRWSRYMRPPQHISPGLISVNAYGSFDWRWLLLGVDYECRQKHQHTCTAGALDGEYGGYPPFDMVYSFACRTRAKLIACHNSLGDAIRWRPYSATPKARPRNRLIVVDHSIGGIRLGEQQASVRRALGPEPYRGYFRGRLWVDYVFKVGPPKKRVQAIRTNWSGFHTRSGIHVGSTLKEVRHLLHAECGGPNEACNVGHGPGGPGTMLWMRHGKVAWIMLWFVS